MPKIGILTEKYSKKANKAQKKKITFQCIKQAKKLNQ